MKKRNLLRLCLCLSVAMLEFPMLAQGVIVYKTDGTKVNFPYSKVDSIVAYNVGEDTVEPEVPESDSRAVDLGLSVKWASCNVGAESPEEYGDYFAWGETTTKSIYNEGSSVTYGLSMSELKSRGIIGADGNLTAAYDAATANWGGNWRMPTFYEIRELTDNCTMEWVTMNGVKGYKFIGPNGNSIFLPAAGGRVGGLLYYADHNGLYWSATPYSDSSNAYDLVFSPDVYNWYGYNRGYGQMVRPVTE